MRIMLFLLILFLMVLFFNSVSVLYYPVSFELLYVLPHIVSLFIVAYSFYSEKKKNKLLFDDSEWCISLCKLSLLISCSVIAATLGIAGRNERLDFISSNNLLYYSTLLNSSILMVVISTLFECINKNLSKKAIIYLIAAIVFFSFTNFSRSVAFFFVIAVLVSKVRINVPLKKVLIVGLPLAIIMLAMPVLQGRTTNIFEAFNRSILNIIFYTSYSFGLGTYLINKTGFDGLSFGYIGYVISRFFNEALPSNSFFDSKYIYDFVNLGSSNIYGDLKANVMYPFWATTYYDFGILSFLPYLFLSAVIMFFNSRKWYILSSWLYFRFLILGFFISPILLRDVIFEILIVFLLQFGLRKRKIRIGRFNL
ncbi:hypothetical protein CI789_04095 [Erwinia persicina]|nr:hypothetical protein CI789_04095 [Erwinia persicina]